MASNLQLISPGALNRMLQGESVKNVVLQILGYKLIPGNNNRFRLLLNDGVTLFPNAILITQLNHLIYNKRLEKFTIFRLKSFEFCQLSGNKQVIICIDIEILKLGSEVNEQITVSSPDISRNIVYNETEQEQVSHTDPPKTDEPFPSTSNVLFKNWDIAPSNSNLNSSVTNEKKSHFTSVSSLSPYLQKWHLKARISYISPVSNYCNARRQGKYFSFHLLDETGEIRAVAFNEEADKYYKILKLFKVYILSNATIKPVRSECPVKFDYEMTIENNTTIEPCINDDESVVPKPIFSFKTLREIQSLPKNSITDVIGVCIEISDVTSIVTKSGIKSISKRNINLIDKSKLPVIVELWGTHADNCTISKNDVIVIKNAKISSFRCISLVATSLSMVYINPDFHKTYELKSWFKTKGAAATHSTSLASNRLTSQNWKTIADVLTNSHVPVYYTTKATIVMVKTETCMYEACISNDCLKKVQDLNNGSYICNKCNNISNSFRWVYLLNLQIADYTGSHWVKAFRDVAESLIGISAHDLKKIKNEDKDKYFDVLNALNMKSFIFNLHSSYETYNGNTSLKTSVLSFSPVETVFYARKLLNDINKMNRL